MKRGRRRIPASLVAAGIALSLAAIVNVPHASAQDEGGFVDQDTLFGKQTFNTSYWTTYDRDRTRGAWGQTLSIFGSGMRSNFDISGAVNTQDFIGAPSKSTLGTVVGNLNLKIIKTWLFIMNGFFAMNSTTDGINGLDSRDNRLSFRTQYTAYPVKNMRTIAAVYSEFEQKHDLTTVARVDRADPFDSTVVDSSIAQRDSSYTTSRKDAASGEIFWPANSWLELYGTGVAFRIHPTITNTQRAFIHPLDGTSGDHISESSDRTHNPTDNTNFTSRITATKIPRTKIVVGGNRSRLRQSYFDKQRAKQESAIYENDVGTLHIESLPRPGFFLYTDAALSQNLSEYALNRTRTTLTKRQKVSSSLAYVDTTTRVTVSLDVSRSVTDLQPSVNGVELSHILGSTGQVRVSRKLVFDGSASINLLSNDYQNDRNDRDVLRSYLSAGAGYMLAPACSTTVHFSRSQGHGIALDPGLSGANAITTTYQMNASMDFHPSRNFTLHQSYILNAEYRILDYIEAQNSLSRVRRIDTDVADTLFSVGFVRLTHNFVYQDQGTYARFRGSANRLYRVATETYDQTLTATAGIKVVPGVVFQATQSLLNRRGKVLATSQRTLQNTWKLNMGLQVFRTLSDGLAIDGAIRRIDEYVEGKSNSNDTTRDDWIAGVSLRKDF